MKLIKNIKARVSCFYSNEDLIIVDENNRIIFFDSAFSLKHGIRLKLPKNKPDENGVRLSENGKYLLIAIDKYITLWDILNKKHIANFTFKHEILALKFSKDSKYFACGGIDGKIYLFNIKLKKKVLELPPHKDFITDIEFNSDRSYIFATSYDKAVCFYNLVTLNKKERYLHIKPAKKIEEKNYLISSDEIAYTVKWDEVSYEYKDIIKIYSYFRDFFIYEDFLILALNNRIFIYNLKDEVIENEKFLELQDIDKITIFKNYLVISTLSGEIYIRDIFEEEKEFLDFIINEKYKETYELINKNPFLKFSKGYEKLNNLIELLIKKALKLYEIDKFKALEILNRLLIIPHLRTKIENIIKQYENFEKFIFAIKEKNYALAYMIADQNPLFKESRYYKQLEKIWEVTFERAKKLIEEGKFEKAKEILEPFMAVSEKLPLIELLLKNAEIYKLLKEKLAKRDFKGFFDLIKKYPELKNTKEYNQVLNYAKILYKLAIKSLNEGNFEKAKKAALILQDIEGYEDKAKEILERIENSLKFLHLLNTNPQKAIEMTEIYPYLKELKEYKEFIKKFNSYVEKVEELINAGDFEKAKIEFQKINMDLKQRFL